MAPPNGGMLWSVLVAGIPERFHSVQPLLYSLLETQAIGRMPDVELLYLLDNRRRPVGSKRNALLDAARGDYVVFIDDDDDVAPDYVRRIYSAIAAERKAKAPADVICFDQRATLMPHNVIHECSYSLDHYRNRKPELRRMLQPAYDAAGALIANALLWTGPPAHTMAWRRELIGSTRFQEVTFGEDTAWVDNLCERAESEIQLSGEPLYFYKFDAERSATRG